MATNPYAAIAIKDENPYAAVAMNTQQQKPAEPSLLQKAGQVATDAFTGVGKGFASTANTLGKIAFPDAAAKALHMPVPTSEQQAAYFAPKNTSEAVGKGLEQAGEFLIPGGAEEEGATKLAGLAGPSAAKFAEPAARVATSALGSGAVNKAQGGSFKTGAALGAGGTVVGQGLKALAPVIGESALGIPKAARAFGKTPGKALLEETRGIRPETIAESAQGRLGQLTPQLERAADAASVRANPVHGLLPAPAEEIPLAPAPSPRNPKMRPMAFNAEINPEEPMEPRSGDPMAPISEYPAINPHYLSGSEHPELAGRVPTRQGVLIRPQEVVGGPVPATIPNRVASLEPARGVISGQMGKAASQNAEGLFGQLGKQQDFLSNRFGTGEPIPENVTPRELLDLKRGFNEEHLRWNPETHDHALSTARQAYGALDSELDRTVPEAAGLNQRISSLIPVAQRAESISRNAPTAQRVLGRFGAHTGALTMGGIGGVAGYHEGGVPGAIAGGVTGVLAPELIASPEGQMIMARTLNKANGLKPLIGGIAQLDRKKEKQ
jgi:hypothetical protein